jgi:hypothetical protein
MTNDSAANGILPPSPMVISNWEDPGDTSKHIRNFMFHAILYTSMSNSRHCSSRCLAWFFFCSPSPLSIPAVIALDDTTFPLISPTITLDRASIHPPPAFKLLPETTVAMLGSAAVTISSALITLWVMGTAQLNPFVFWG